jgi:hypothetical protein
VLAAPLAQIKERTETTAYFPALRLLAVVVAARSPTRLTLVWQADRAAVLALGPTPITQLGLRGLALAVRVTMAAFPSTTTQVLRRVVAVLVPWDKTRRIVLAVTAALGLRHPSPEHPSPALAVVVVAVWTPLVPVERAAVVRDDTLPGLQARPQARSTRVVVVVVPMQGRRRRAVLAL